MKAFLAALLLLRAPCAGAAVRNPDTFVYLASSDGDSLDPAWSYDGRTHAIIDNVYEYLLTFPPGGLLKSDLAPSLSTAVPTRANGLVSPDGLTYRFPIRRGVRFHDGSLMTPADVRYSLLRFMLFDRAAGPSSLLLNPILGEPSTRRDGRLVPGLYERAAKAVSVDGGDVVVRLARPYAPFLTVLARFGAVTSRAWCAAHGQWDGEAGTWERFNDPKLQDALPNGQADGTGAFKLERFDKTNRQVILVRNDAYWRGPAPLKRVVFKVVPEFGTRKLMLEAGDADSIDASLSNLSQLQGLPGVEIIPGLQRPELGPFLTFNFRVNPAGNPNVGSGRLDGAGIPPTFFADKDVRKAFAYSVDYAAFIRDVNRGQGRQASGFIPTGFLGHRDGPPRYRFDLALAEAHFRKAWGGEAWKNGFRFGVPYTEGNDDMKGLVQMLKKNVESLNPRFRIDLYPMAGSSLMAQSALRQRTMSLEHWSADFPDPDNFAFPLLHSQGMYSGNGYRSAEADALIAKAEAEPDDRKREAIYARLQDIADEDEPFVLVTEAASYRAQRRWVKGFRFRPIFPSEPWNSYYYELSKSER